MLLKNSFRIRIIFVIGFFLLLKGAFCLDWMTVTIHGKVLKVEVAESFKDKKTGLQNRKSLDENSGMLFVYQDTCILSFWMKNTLIPLSIGFIAGDGTLLQIEDMEPGNLTPVLSHKECCYALEVNRGWFLKNQVKPGDKVELGELEKLIKN